MLGASQIALIGSAFAAVTYDELVDTFRVDGVSYWKFANHDGADVWGTEHATYKTLPSEGPVATIVDLDTIAEGAPADGTCTAWTGALESYADAAHNAAHKTAEGTIVVSFQLDTLSQKSTLVAADANSAAGGLSMEVQTNGAPRCFLRRQSDGSGVILTGQPGDVQVNAAYTLIFKWGPGGLSMTLWNDSGNPVRVVTDPLTDGVTGTSPLRFGAWHTGVGRHDGPYGRVIWLKRRISDPQEANLARARTISRTGAIEWTVDFDDYLPDPPAAHYTDVVAVRNAAAAAIADAEANAPPGGRGVIELTPGVTYVSQPASNGSLPRPNGIFDIVGRSNIEIRTKGMPLKHTPKVPGVQGQATIQMDNWQNYTNNNNSLVWRACISCREVTNIVIGWLELDGNSLSTGTDFLSRSQWIIANLKHVNGAGNGGMFNLSWHGANNCMVKEVYTHHGLTDGFYTRNWVGASFPFRNFIAEDVESAFNRRTCLTIDEWDTVDSEPFAGVTYDNNVIFRRCNFHHAGQQDGVIDPTIPPSEWYPGEAPGESLDVEPLNSAHRVVGCLFDDCDFQYSGGFGLIRGQWRAGNPSNPPSTYDFNGNGVDMNGFQVMRFFRWINCRFNNNAMNGFRWVTKNDIVGYLPQVSNVQVINCEHKNNNRRTSEGGAPSNYVIHFGWNSVEGIATYNPLIYSNMDFGGSGGFFFDATGNTRVAASGHDVDIYKGGQPTPGLSTSATSIVILDGYAPGFEP